ncbi:prenyltransferase alpha subunit repeat-containing 1-B protein [Rutstroemia sp. NJR-2017a BBW]|nr:prenyltransferase alpha subunit repeat-containing 1-B protein [Rutstroemia sp. NJR-2017a BBW]
MSRALDKDAKASAAAIDSQAVYNEIVEVLSSNNYPELLEIEFLGKGHILPPGTNVLVEVNSIGIPKTKLIQAFVVARQIFFNHINDDSSARYQDIRNSTAVILLTDPEHLTAANARKRLIQKVRKDNISEIEEALTKELYFIDSLLTSRLNRHTKSPTLWGHRKWLLEVRQSIGLRHDIHRDLASIVMIAAERHPRNYYAWSHMRWLVESVEDGLDASSNDLLISDVKNWCVKHPSDTSGWSFLLFCLIYISPLPRETMAAQIAKACEEVVAMAVSWRWKGESLWGFLRTLVTSGRLSDEAKRTILEPLENMLHNLPEDTKIRRMIQEVHDHCLQYEQNNETGR